MGITAHAELEYPKFVEPTGKPRLRKTVGEILSIKQLLGLLAGVC